jgi:hypothetical protein
LVVFNSRDVDDETFDASFVVIDIDDEGDEGDEPTSAYVVGVFVRSSVTLLVVIETPFVCEVISCDVDACVTDESVNKKGKKKQTTNKQ